MRLLVTSLKPVRSVGQVLNKTEAQYRTMSTRGIKFNTKHLRKGDPLPPYNGKLRLYNMRYCPFAQRTVLALNAKDIDYEVVNINLFEKPEWLTSKSAFGKVPSLEIKEGLSIYESLVTVEYLDEVYPQRPLLPKDPVQRALDKIIVEACTPIQGLFIKLIKFPETITEETVAAYHKALHFLQEQLQSRGSRFFGGDQPGFVDYMIWPWFERVLPYQKVESRVQIDAGKFKLLLEYLQNLKQDPVVKQYLIEDEVLFKFLEPYKTGGEPNYDLLLEA
ncbi:hypothetical protein JYU34_021073 [Plutella xylostella]|uniref:Glutathione S-transferase n=1 Tax=Plutella xylostella TaxID=51655 RepID=A0ABQ7PSN8_PLUXY|nr:hypothetical protein JYU34_021073 [Plutella xylostella]